MTIIITHLLKASLLSQVVEWKLRSGLNKRVLQWIVKVSYQPGGF